MGDQKDRAGPEASLAGEDSSPTSRWKVGVCIAPAYQMLGAGSSRVTLVRNTPKETVTKDLGASPDSYLFMAPGFDISHFSSLNLSLFSYQDLCV